MLVFVIVFVHLVTLLSSLCLNIIILLGPNCLPFSHLLVHRAVETDALCVEPLYLSRGDLWVGRVVAPHSVILGLFDGDSVARAAEARTELDDQVVVLASSDRIGPIPSRMLRLASGCRAKVLQ